MLYLNFGKGVEFFPKVEPELAVIQIHARGNLSVREKSTLVGEVEERILEMNRKTGGIVSVYSEAGNLQTRDDEAEDVIGNIQLEFDDWDLRRPADVILADIIERSSDLDGIIIETRKEERGPPVGKPVQVQLSSRYPALLEKEVARVRRFVDGIEGLKDIEDSRPMPGIEWEITVDRAQAAKFGADVQLIGNAIKFVTNGMRAAEYRPDDSDGEIDIIARYPVGDRTIEQLDDVRVQTAQGMVPLSNFVTRKAVPRTGTLHRVDAVRVMTIKADVLPGVLADDKVTEIRTWLDGADIDARIAVTFKGEDEEQQAAAAFLQKAFGIALFLMAIILVTQFNSFYSALLILSAVIMSTVGVMLGLLIIGQPFSIVMSGIGVIALAGIVVNNNIVLIDTFDLLRRKISDPVQAILLTGAQRLRPVLLTTVTTILGLMPMVLQINIDFVSREISQGAPSTQWWVQLATAIAAGLTFATVLTLLITPCALMLRENTRLRRARRAAAGAQPAE
jgi:multidrug efflux pump